MPPMLHVCLKLVPKRAERAGLTNSSDLVLEFVWTSLGLSFLTALSIYQSNYLYQDSLAKYLAMMKIYYQIYCLLLLMTA